MVIKLTNVSKVIKKAKVLDNVNLELTSGKVYGLKGKNGSGKTMLMRVICGLISATEGTVEIDGKILGKDMTFPDSVGVLIENPAFIGNYTGFKNLKVLASIQNRVDDEHIREVIHQVGLDPDDKRTYRKYSLGMSRSLELLQPTWRILTLSYLMSLSTHLMKQEQSRFMRYLRNRRREAHLS